MPFAPVHLLFINLLTDSLPAIALGMEPHSKAVMDQKPRPVNESILTKAYLVNIGTEGLCIGIMTMAILDRIQRTGCSSGKYDGVWNIVYEPSGTWI